jgi:NodT family efflux transporter outer membrane factor (OMF) lipoprotein
MIYSGGKGRHRWAGLKITALAIGLLVLASCTVGPDYIRPGAEVAAGYKELDGWQVARPNDDTLRGPWWEMFNEPDLNALESLVDVSNQTIAQAEAAYRQAVALVQQARAAYFPTVTVGFSIPNSSSSTTIRNESNTTRTNTTHYTLPVDVSWQIDVFGRIRRQVESASASAQASAADLATAQLAIQTELAQDYFQLRALDAQKKLLDENVVDFQKSLELTQNQYAAGIVSRADVLQAQTQLQSTQAQAIDVEVQRAQFEHAIAVLVGQPPAEITVADMALAGQPPAIPVGFPSELLERRPDIASAERLVAAANAQIGVAEAAYYPTVTLHSVGGFDTTSSSKLFSLPSRFWAVGPTVTQTVFDGGLRAGQTAQARAVYDANVARYRQAVLTGFQQVEDNVAALKIFESEAQVQDEAVKAAQQTVTVFTNQYKAGIVNYLNVIVAQTAALNNERTAITIMGNRFTAAVLLIKALGGGWDVSDLPASP